MSLLHSQPAPSPEPYAYGDSLTDEEEEEEEFEDVDDDNLDDEYYQPGIDMCIVCRRRPPGSNGRRKYPTCGMTCADVLINALTQHPPPRRSPSNSHRGRGGSPRGGAPSTPSRTRKPPPQFAPGAYAPQQYYAPQYQYAPQPRRASRPPQPQGGYQAHAGPSHVQYAPRRDSRPCVICKISPCYGRHVTCGKNCTEKLFTNGPPDATKCNYCHRRRKVTGHDQCGNTCGAKAKLACLLCKSRPKYRSYHLCGKTCKQISVRWTPLLLEAPPGHVSHKMVENKFKAAWGVGATAPVIKHIYKIIENNSFLQPYDAYKKRVGNEVFRYHGTKRSCTLGTNGNTKLCSGTCALCSILKTSFKTSLSANGSFGRGIYSSSSSQGSYGYTGGTGAMFLTKVVLGKIWDTCTQGHVTSLQPGYDSVVYNPANAPAANETIVYTDDAIRPVFLIVF